MKKFFSIFAALSLSIMLAGCAEKNTQSKAPNAFAKETFSYSEKKESKPEASSAITINGDVMWGIGKTVDEVTEKYGDITASALDVYMFEKGYGRYVFGDSCYKIGEISASDFLVGDLSTVMLDNIAEKCGFKVVPLNEPGDPNTMYDGYRLAYYTHPSYENVTFGMLYNENGFDETAKFDVRFNSET